MDENRLEETFRKHAEGLEPRRPPSRPRPTRPGHPGPGEEVALVGEVDGGAGGHLSGQAPGTAP